MHVNFAHDSDWFGIARVGAQCLGSGFWLVQRHRGTLMFVAVVTIIPLVCSTRLGNKIHLGHEKSLIDRNLTRISQLVEFVLTYPRTVSVIGIVSTLVIRCRSEIWLIHFPAMATTVIV